MVRRMEHLRIFRHLALYSRTTSSLLGADADTCGISDQGAAIPYQEVHLPYES